MIVKHLLQIVLIFLMAGCDPTGHQKSLSVYKDEIATFGQKNCKINTVTIVTYKNVECFCMSSQYNNIYNDNDSTVIRNLNLRNKKLLFCYLRKDDSTLKQIDLSGWQSSIPVAVDGYSVVFSLVPMNSVQRR